MSEARTLGAVKKRELHFSKNECGFVRQPDTSRFNEIIKSNKINKGVLCLYVDRHKPLA